MKAKELMKRIEQAGGQLIRQRGSHLRYRLERGDMTLFTTIPQHGGDIPTGTLSAIDRDLAPILGKGWTR